MWNIYILNSNFPLSPNAKDIKGKIIIVKIHSVPEMTDMNILA